MKLLYENRSWSIFLNKVLSLLLPTWPSCCSVSQLCLTVALQASLSFIISWSLLKLMSIESLILFNHFILCQPLLLLPSVFPRIRVFSSVSALHIKCTKYWLRTYYTLIILVTL